LGGEVILRSAGIQRRLAPPSVGSSHTHFELHVANLDKLAAENDAIDCIFTGSSLVLSGIDAGAVSDALGIVCYSFAVPGLTFETGETLVEFLTNRYDPQVIVYGFSPLAFKTRPYDAVQTQVKANALVQYEVGHPSLQGFLLEYSSLYGYYLRYGSWSRNDFSASLDELRALDEALSAYGFLAQSDAPLDLTRDISPDFLGLPLDAVNTAAFRELLTQAEQGNPRIVFLQMPLHARIIEANSQDYQLYEAYVSETILDTDLMLWQSPIDLSDDNWSDYAHLNVAGAALLSAWVAEQLEAILD
jgi:hypothetical protein